jgi:hypothetical protein
VPASGKSSSSRPKLIVAIVAVVLLLGVGAYFVFGRSGGDSKLSGKKALVTVNDLVDRADLSGQGSAHMSDCPIGNLDKLVALGPAGVGDIARKASKSAEKDEVYQSDHEREPPIVECFYLNVDDTSATAVNPQVGVFAAEKVAGNYHSYLRGLYSESTLHFETDQSFRGGTRVDYCGDAVGDTGSTFCESDWYDDNIQVGVYLTGDGQSVQLTGEWLKAALPTMLRTLEGDPSKIDVSPPTT